MSNKFFDRAIAICRVASLLGLTLGLVPSAAIAAPPNDQLTGAVVVSAVPFAQILDTTSATTDADDAQVNSSCGAPLTNNSVWYTYTAGPSDQVLTVDVYSSNFSAGAIVATGTPGSLVTLACAPSFVLAVVTPGTTYYVLAFDDTGSGGQLDITIDALPVPSVSFKIRRRGSVDASGLAAVNVSYTCADASIMAVSAQLVQIADRAVVEGYSGVQGYECDGLPHEVTLYVAPLRGAYVPKRVAVLADGYVCNNFVCTDSLHASRATLLRSSPGLFSATEPFASGIGAPTDSRPLYYRSVRAGEK